MVRPCLIQQQWGWGEGEGDTRWLHAVLLGWRVGQGSNGFSLFQASGFTSVNFALDDISASLVVTE